MKTKQLSSGLYTVIKNGVVNVYTQKQYNLMYVQNVWWSKIKSKYFET